MHTITIEGMYNGGPMWTPIRPEHYLGYFDEKVFMAFEPTNAQGAVNGRLMLVHNVNSTTGPSVINFFMAARQHALSTISHDTVRAVIQIVNHIPHVISIERWRAAVMPLTERGAYVTSNSGIRIYRHAITAITNGSNGSSANGFSVNATTERTGYTLASQVTLEGAMFLIDLLMRYPLVSFGTIDLNALLLARDADGGDDRIHEWLSPAASLRRHFGLEDEALRPGEPRVNESGAPVENLRRLDLPVEPPIEPL